MSDQPTAPVLPPSYTLAGASYTTHPASPARALALYSATQAKGVDLPIAMVLTAALALTSKSSSVVWRPGAVLSWIEAVFDDFTKKGIKLNGEVFEQGPVAWAHVINQVPWEKEVKEAEDFSEAPPVG